MKDILVTGGAGQVGLALARQPRHPDVRLVFPTRRELDLSDPEAISRAIASRPWSAVINAAAYTAVDRAESESDEAWRVNATAPGVIANACAKSSIPLVHVSTDYVFAGDLDRPYEEDDPVAPLGVYGRSKAAGEAAVRTGAPRHAIVRTAWVLSATRSNFLLTMSRLAKQRPIIRVVSDQWGCPTASSDLAAALMKVAVRMIEDPAAPTGTFHYTNEGVTTWADLAAEIFRISRANCGPGADVEKISTAEYPTASPRPRYSALAPGRLPAAFDIARRPWQTAVLEIVKDLIRSGDV